MTYQGGSVLNKESLKKLPSGNGDITSALKILPNIQFRNVQLSSNTPGEINPADIVISGGLYFQNAFMLDGFNINNDINSNGHALESNNNHLQWGSSKSQGMAIDSSLIDSIKVYDSNVPAKFGGFGGGVVESTTIRPKNDGKVHGDISFQWTGDRWQKAHIDEESEESYNYNTSENFQPEFTKYILRASLNGYITDKFGLIGSYSTTRSKIPVYAYNSSSQYGDDIGSKVNQRRQIDNFFLKGYWTPSDTFNLESTINYAPQKNTYYRMQAKNSFWELQSGGLQLGLKATNDFEIGQWINQLQYSKFDSTRDAQINFWRNWKRSTTKNWGGASATMATEGGFGDMEQTQTTYEAKTEFDFKEFDAFGAMHKISVGADFRRQSFERNRVNGYFVTSTGIGGLGKDYIADLAGRSCGIDNLGLDACDPRVTYDGWNGQYINQVRQHRPGFNKYYFSSYGAFIEDDAKFDLRNLGELNLRLGLRLDGDNFMDKKTVAPRFAMTYVAPWGMENNTRSSFTLGVNRYYSRNIFNLRLNDSSNVNGLSYWYRTEPGAWTEDTTNRTNGVSDSMYKKLKIPFTDEFMAGIKQDIGALTFEAKYINRKGKDEIVRKYDVADKPGYSGYTTGSANTWHYLNDGKTKNKIFTLSFMNTEPFEIANTKHTFMLAFDYTDTKRGYNPTFTSSDSGSDYIDDKIIMYDGKMIKYRDRPLEDFATPWTLRLSTMSSFRAWDTDFTLSNFFRLRDGYEAMVLTGMEGRCEGNNYPASRCPSGKLYKYDTFEKKSFSKAFTWDMRVGFEKKLYKDHTLYANLDVFNVLNKKHEASVSQSSGSVNYSSAEYANVNVPVYENGRQFWLQVGYKF